MAETDKQTVEPQAAFRNRELAEKFAASITAASAMSDGYAFMEVCGTHTQAIGRWALRSMLPENIRLVSGPGCPVCVTPGEYIDNAAMLAAERGVTVATFGDLVRVPGDTTSLEQARSAGGDIRVVYSPFDAVELAEQDRRREVVFLAIGFETTIAGIAATIKAAIDRKLDNLSFYLSLKLVPPALDALVADPDVKIDGFILPGHVSVIIGRGAYGILEERGVPGAIAGFEPVDILRTVNALVDMVNSGRPEVANLYPRVVTEEGNRAAKNLFEQLFEQMDEVWRGIGRIPRSGYKLRKEFSDFDAKIKYGLGDLSGKLPAGCGCGKVLKGIIPPDECPLFGKTCTPGNPVGPCMVSGEGSCAAYYRYGR